MSSWVRQRYDAEPALLNSISVTLWDIPKLIGVMPSNGAINLRLIAARP
jgi:hypothetical protein